MNCQRDDCRSDAIRFAEQLTDWFQDYDVYEYNDRVDDCASYVDELAAQIESGNVKEMEEYLQLAVEEGDKYDCIIIRANKLLKKLHNFM